MSGIDFEALSGTYSRTLTFREAFVAMFREYDRQLRERGELVEGGDRCMRVDDVNRVMVDSERIWKERADAAFAEGARAGYDAAVSSLEPSLDEMHARAQRSTIAFELDGKRDRVLKAMLAKRKEAAS